MSKHDVLEGGKLGANWGPFGSEKCSIWTLWGSNLEWIWHDFLHFPRATSHNAFWNAVTTLVHFQMHFPSPFWCGGLYATYGMLQYTNEQTCTYQT